MDTIDFEYYKKMRSLSENLFIAVGDILHQSKE